MGKKNNGANPGSIRNIEPEFQTWYMLTRRTPGTWTPEQCNVSLSPPRINAIAHTSRATHGHR